VTDLEPPARSTSQAVEGKLRFTVNQYLEPENDGTRFTYKVEADSGLGGIFGGSPTPSSRKRNGAQSVGTLTPSPSC